MIKLIIMIYKNKTVKTVLNKKGVKYVQKTI